MNVKPKHTVDELRTLQSEVSSHRLKERIQIVLWAMEGWTGNRIAQERGLCRRRVQDWIRRFNELGIDGLTSSWAKLELRVPGE